MSEMKHLPPTLETERLILRPITIEDKSAIYKWAGDPSVAKYMIYPIYQSEDDADIWLRDLYVKEKELDYGFVWKETGELIGSGGIYYKPEKDSWSLGYNIRQDMWGKGIAVEACKKIFAFAKEEYGARVIRANFAIDNSKSRRVMEKLGMTYLEDTEYTKLDGSETFKAKTYQMIL